MTDMVDKLADALLSDHIDLMNENKLLREELSDALIKLDNAQVGAEYIYQENEQLRAELDEIKYDRSTRIEFAARVLEDHDMLEAGDRLRSLITPQLEDE